MELRELPPGGREVQVPRGFCSPPRLSLGPFAKAALSPRRWREVRVGGGPAACLLTAPPGLVLQPCQRYPSSAETGSSSRAQQLRPRAGFAGAALRLGAQLSAGKAAAVPPACAFSLCLSFSSFSLCVQVTHYMGFCSFGTSSSFQICPGTSGAVTGMLRTRSVDYRDCTNERIQAVLVSREGVGTLLSLVFPQPVSPSTSNLRGLLPAGPTPSPVPRGSGGSHTCCKVEPPSRAPPSFFAPLQCFLPASSRGGGLWGESNCSSNFEGAEGDAQRGT